MWYPESVRQLAGKAALLLAFAALFPAGLFSQETPEKPAKNALNLYPLFTSAVVTAVMAGGLEGGGLNLFMAGIGYERAVAGRFSLYGGASALFIAAPFALPWFDGSLAGRYYFGGTALKGPYAALAAGYSRFAAPPVIDISLITISALAGYKFRTGRFYIELEAGGGAGFGKFTLDFLGISESAVGFVPHLALNAGIVL